MRTTITSQIPAGAIVDYRLIGIPQYVRITNLTDLDGVTRAIGHLALEVRGGKRTARQYVSRLNRFVRRLAEYVGRTGGYVMIECNGWNQGYPGTMGIGFEAVIFDGRHSHRVRMAACYGIHVERCKDHSEPCTVHSYPTRVDVLMRRLEADRLIRAAAADQKRAAANAAYIAGLPEPIRSLQQTARPSCIRVSADGTTVHECLHDCGGSMSSRVGVNGFSLPGTLADMQAAHDAIYHTR